MALLTDLYQLTMAQGYWKLGRQAVPAAFNLYFRTAPFDEQHAIACGLGPALDFLESYRFTETDLDYLGRVPAPGGGPLFDPAFLLALGELELEVDVIAVPEGTVVFANEPLLRVEGPLLQAQLLETALLTHLNFSTLVATKAARVCEAADHAPVLEFGLRRAQGVDGGLTASRAAFIGGCTATSNVLAGQRFGIPVRGTHAHSWVMSFHDEHEAFEAYAEVMPNNCILLVDTYDTIEGIVHAIEVGQRLRQEGKALAGIRLDSGDLAALSRRARSMLDEAGLDKVKIVASDGLNEYEIARLRSAGAAIDVWGVGTHLATSHDQPALGGVYKLAAIADRVTDGDPSPSWRPTMKRSSDPSKASLPGRLQVRRNVSDDEVWTDTIYDVDDGFDGPGHDLLVPVFEGGRRVAEAVPTEEVRERAVTGMARFRHASGRVRVEVAQPLAARRDALMAQMKA